MRAHVVHTFYAHQPGRMRGSRTQELDRAWRSTIKSRRPVCALCHQVAPAPDEPRQDWLQNYCHRAPPTPEQAARGIKGDPCKGNIMLPAEYREFMWQQRGEVKWPELDAALAFLQVPLFVMPANEAPPPERVRRLRGARPRVQLPPQLQLFDSIEELLSA